MKVSAEHRQLADVLVYRWMQTTSGNIGALVESIAEALQNAHNEGARSVVIYDARQHLSELVNILVDARSDEERQAVLRNFRVRMLKEMAGER